MRVAAPLLLTFVVVVCPYAATAFVVPHSSRAVRTAPRPFATRISSTAEADETCDVLVLGAGPTGRAIASLLAEQNFKITLADANYDSPFVPNYGVWQDEWDAVVDRYAQQHNISIDGGKCGKSLDREWDYTDCFFGGSFDKPMDERMTLPRPYCRVDKDALRDSLTHRNVKALKMNHISKATSVNLYSPAGSMVHDEEGTTTVLKSADGSQTATVRSKLVIDTTGHESTLVLRDSRAPASALPGFQIAYGCLAEINEKSADAVNFGPYDKEAMTLFDYRTDHLEFDPAWEKRAIEEPTFMYVMPLEGNKVFFEETSLVARPGVSFQECKDRCMQRLKYLGIDVNTITEEEYCYIPMGGSLPIRDQRVIGLGGSTAMVHPSTGYHICRMLMGASDVAKAVAKELSQDEVNVDRAAAAAYHAVWTPENIRQRNFAVFGGEFLMKQTVVGLRGFFDGFFKLPLGLWAGFLAGWPGLPNNDKHESWYTRMFFGLSFIVKLPLPVALDMFLNIVTYSITEGAPLPQSVTPLLGEPPSYEYRPHLEQNVGDNNAKQEARKMMQETNLPLKLGEMTEDSSAPSKEKIATVESLIQSTEFVEEAVPVEANQDFS